ncbi:MAG: hypothetical protein HKN43_03190 [Rhodothermales bacterium]|nr:hypothetical protein [Rhodothermales bacterium]
MEAVKHAIDNISDEDRKLFIKELSHPRESFESMMSNPVPVSATPKQYKPTKAEKKAAKRRRVRS